MLVALLFALSATSSCQAAVRDAQSSEAAIYRSRGYYYKKLHQDLAKCHDFKYENLVDAWLSWEAAILTYNQSHKWDVDMLSLAFNEFSQCYQDFKATEQGAECGQEARDLAAINDTF
jgi:hypothetical protein